MVRAMMADGETLENAQARANAFENDEPEPGAPSQEQETPAAPEKNLGGKTVSEAFFGKKAEDADWKQNLMSGAAKGVTSTFLGAGKLSNKAERSFLLPVERFFGKDTSEREAQLARQNQVADEILASGKLSGETAAESVGKGAEQVAEFFTPLGGAGKAEKALAATEKAAVEAPRLVKLAKGLGEFLSGTAKAAPLASAQAGGNEGEGLMNAAGGQALQQGVAAVGKKVLQPLAGKLWEKLVPLSPGKSAAVAEKGLDIGGSLAETPGTLGIKGVFGSREALKGAVQGEVSRLGGELSKAIDGYAAANPGKTFPTRDLVKAVEESVLDPKNEKRLMADLGITKKDLSSALDDIGENLAREAEAYGPELTPQALQAMKRDLQAVVGKAYDKSAVGTPLKSADLIATKSLASEARKVIEGAIPSVGPLNKQMAPLIEALDVLTKKGAYSGVLTDTIAAAGAGGNELYNTGDPIRAIQAAVVGVLAKRAATSTAARSLTAKILSELGKLSQNVPGQAVIAATKGDAGSPSPLESSIENYLNPAQ